ncbi:phosphoribosylanthranilate isomerase [Sulfitobacter sp. 15WGC]|uniref:phosphoribosylanthranilate isomerase n=1 Tax=Sulfitobacter sp. 15WGC TaxID=2575437 RepID=UPI0010AD9295|nr:phosphoribosylanthranilate isomerase [Sulfitobacter sp. 15WGC]TKA85327.1 phosphoribosylanthranilate isomerase [Sulfitobacter sp. 15WGC]
MPENVNVKICGLTDPADVPAALLAGARTLGFVFSKIPRHLSLEAAAHMTEAVPDGICKVALTVNADDAALDALLAAVPFLDMLQLHGSESPARVAEVKARYGLPVMKAVGVADRDDLALLNDYVTVADQLLLDAKPPKDAVLPGGNGLAFDWRLIAGRRWPKPWMLAGGLNAENVGEAIALTGARQVDVSSGVESAPGMKDAERIRAFCEAALK